MAATHPTAGGNAVVGAAADRLRPKANMSTLAWVVVAGLAMSALALVGTVTVFMPARALARVVLPMVGLAAGSLLGGAFFHMLPESVDALGNERGVYLALVAGFVVFFVLEQLLHWHHRHRVEHVECVDRRPLGYLILLADGLHNMIGGLAVGGAFVVDTRVGIVAWLVAAGHEIPQELGDFGVLVHSGWTRSAALLWNFTSALTFLAGALVAYALADHMEVAYLLPFAAGNFIYIAAADLLPEITSEVRARDKLETSATFLIGLAILLVIAVLA